MVRGKVELRRIDDRARRLSSFSKRRNGLLKKAGELSVLCDADVGVIVFSPKGKLSHYSSHSSLKKTIERYEKFLDAERSVRNHVHEAEGQHVGFSDHQTDNEAPKEDQRFFGDGKLEQLDVNQLTKLEEKLESSLRQIRIRKASLLEDLVTKFREQGRTLLRENQQLQAVVSIDGEDGGEPGGSDGISGPRAGAGTGSSSSSSTGSNDAASALSPPDTLQLFRDT